MVQINLIPVIFQNYQLFKAEQECKLPLRLALIGLLNCCDENKVFGWQPRYLKIKILPFKEIDINQVLEVLVKHNFIGKHKKQGRTYGYVLSTVLFINLT